MVIKQYTTTQHISIAHTQEGVDDATLVNFHKSLMAIKGRMEDIILSKFVFIVIDLYLDLWCNYNPKCTVFTT